MVANTCNFSFILTYSGYHSGTRVVRVEVSTLEVIELHYTTTHRNTPLFFVVLKLVLGHTWLSMYVARLVHNELLFKVALANRGLWQNRAAVDCSMQLMPQSSESQARTIAQEAAKACLDKLSSDRGRACAVSRCLLSVQQVAVAHTAL